MKYTVRTSVALTAAAAALVLSSCSSKTSTGPATSAPSSTGSAGAAAPAGAHNKADTMFATMMVPHHAQAIEMADIALGKSGLSAEVTSLAKKIKAAQTPEIDKMQGWLKTWGEASAPTAAPMSGMDHGGGMMSSEDMTKLKAAAGKDFEKMFLKMMITHHTSAIAQAKAETKDGQSADAKALAASIISSQQGEIDEMKKLLGA